MAEKEGPSRLGRFIKKNDPILDFVNVSEFKLSEVTKSPMMIPDNTANSIIHAKLHMERAIQAGTKPYLLTDNDLTPEGSRRPVLIPIDFTEDWQRMRARSSKKEIYMDDEDYFFFEAANRTAKAHGEPSKDPALDQGQDGLPGTSQGTGGTVGVAPVEPSGQLAKEREILDVVSSQIPKEQDQFTGSGLVLARNTAEPQVTQKAAQSEASKPEPTPELDQAMLEEIMQKGYDEGYRHAQQVVQEELQAESDKRSGQIAELMDHLEHLKKEILHSAQDNFRTICQSLMESLLQKEFHLNPEAFANVINRAIDEAVGADKFKIKVNPAAMDQLVALSPAKLKDHLVADEAMAPGDFSIESSQGVVDGKLKKLVSDLLNQANLDLYNTETDEVAS